MSRPPPSAPKATKQLTQDYLPHKSVSVSTVWTSTTAGHQKRSAKRKLVIIIQFKFVSEVHEELRELTLSHAEVKSMFTEGHVPTTLRSLLGEVTGSILLTTSSGTSSSQSSCSLETCNNVNI